LRIVGRYPKLQSCIGWERRLRTCLAIVLGLSLLIGRAVLAQGTVSPDSVPVDEAFRFYDQPIDPDLYLIRPGEDLTVTFIGAKLSSLGLKVDAEGKVVHRNLGLFDLSGKTLSEVRRLLSEPLRALYQCDRIEISVGDPYRAVVAVSGAVEEPGLYFGYTSQTVAELIEKAGGVAPGGSVRMIVFGGGAADIVVDLDRVRFLGDQSANPCLYAGRRIHVPPGSRATVNVVGWVNFPREVELLPGDDLALMVDLAGGVIAGGDFAATYLLGDPDRRPLNTEYQPAAGDVLVVPASAEVLDGESVEIFGAVARPGRFPYRSDLTLSALVATAGGEVTGANSGRITVYRKPPPDEWGVARPGRFAVTPPLLGRGAFDQLPLKPSDSVFVPALVGYVTVSGRVRSPGLVMYVADETAAFYISAAGGYTTDADRSELTVVNRATGISTVASPEVIVHDGDEVIVNRMVVTP
jgi:protein involved in polysaccharide export with SLBB domain